MIELGLHVLRIAAHLIGLAVLCLAFAVSAAVDLATHRGRVKDAELHPEPEQASR